MSLQAAATPEWSLAQLAVRPERIMAMLRADQQFRLAYEGLLTSLTKLGNGNLKVADPSQLQQANQRALHSLVANETKWRENACYSRMLDALSKKDNLLVRLHTPGPQQTLKAVMQEMQENPGTPLCWSVNGNNHFPTHEKLRDMISSIAELRGRLNDATEGNTRDLLIISGNAAQKTPYGPGPLGKYIDSNGTPVGTLSEAEAIKSLLFPEHGSTENFDVILETNSCNTRENLRFTNAILSRPEMQAGQHIRVNSQSGFSGLRSALTSIGWQNTDQLPSVLNFLNPDLSVEEAIDAPSFEFAGKTFLQAMRECMNLTADVSRELFMPAVRLPPKMLDDLGICLRKIGIEPDTTPATQVQDALREMHAVAMRSHPQRLIGPFQSYASAGQQFSADNRQLRERQNVIKKIFSPLPLPLPLYSDSSNVRSRLHNLTKFAPCPNVAH